MRLYLRKPPGQPTISKVLFFLKQQSPKMNFIIKPYGRLPDKQFRFISLLQNRVYQKNAKDSTVLWPLFYRGGFFDSVGQNCTRLQISCRGAAQAPCSSTYWIKVSSMVMLWGLPMTWGCMATTIRPFFAFRMP